MEQTSELGQRLETKKVKQTFVRDRSEQLAPFKDDTMNM